MRAVRLANPKVSLFQSLNLSNNNRLTKRGRNHLAGLVASGLRHLSLAKTKIGDEGLRCIAAKIGGSKLETLDLSEIGLTVSPSFTDHFQQGPAHLHGTALQAFFAALPSNRTLRSLIMKMAQNDEIRRGMLSQISRSPQGNLANEGGCTLSHTAIGKFKVVGDFDSLLDISNRAVRLTVKANAAKPLLLAYQRLLLAATLHPRLGRDSPLIGFPTRADGGGDMHDMIAAHLSEPKLLLELCRTPACSLLIPNCLGTGRYDERHQPGAHERVSGAAARRFVVQRFAWESSLDRPTLVEHVLQELGEKPHADRTAHSYSRRLADHRRGGIMSWKLRLSSAGIEDYALHRPEPVLVQLRQRLEASGLGVTARMLAATVPEVARAMDIAEAAVSAVVSRLSTLASMEASELHFTAFATSAPHRVIRLTMRGCQTLKDLKTTICAALGLSHDPSKRDGRGYENGPRLYQHLPGGYGGSNTRPFFDMEDCCSACKRACPGPPCAVPWTVNRYDLMQMADHQGLHGDYNSSFDNDVTLARVVSGTGGIGVQSGAQFAVDDGGLCGEPVGSAPTFRSCYPSDLATALPPTLNSRGTAHHPAWARSAEARAKADKGLAVPDRTPGPLDLSGHDVAAIERISAAATENPSGTGTLSRSGPIERSDAVWVTIRRPQPCPPKTTEATGQCGSFDTRYAGVTVEGKFHREHHGQQLQMAATDTLADLKAAASVALGVSDPDATLCQFLPNTGADSLSDTLLEEPSDLSPTLKSAGVVGASWDARKRSSSSVSRLEGTFVGAPASVFAIVTPADRAAAFGPSSQEPLQSPHERSGGSGAEGGPASPSFEERVAALFKEPASAEETAKYGHLPFDEAVKQLSRARLQGAGAAAAAAGVPQPGFPAGPGVPFWPSTAAASPQPAAAAAVGAPESREDEEAQLMQAMQESLQHPQPAKQPAAADEAEHS
eukprot:COSAG04_NODE_1717_length_5817_cov_3.452256_3_plen_952_part_01